MHELAQYLVNGILVGSTYAVVAVGFALTFSALRVINMTYPDLFMLAMFVGLAAVGFIGPSLPVVLIIAVIGAALGGVTVERLVLRPLRGTPPLVPMLATIGASVFIQNGVQAIVGPDPLPFPPLVPFARFDLGGIVMTSGQLTSFVLAAVVLVGASFYVRGTRWGLQTRALAEHPDIAAACGVDVVRVSQLTTGLSSALAGIAGIGIAVQYGSAWVFVGLLYALKAFICVLVAGNRHVEGPLVVGLLLGVLETLTSAYVSSNYRDVIAFVMLIAILYVRPRGIFGSYA